MSMFLKVDISKAQQKLRAASRAMEGRGGGAAGGAGGTLKPAFQAAGESLLSDIQTSFKQKARGETDDAGISWPRISWLTWLFRPKGRERKVKSWSELKRHADDAEVGRSTGGMQGSLSSGAKHVFEATAVQVTLGTRHEHAERFHNGGAMDPFKVTPEMYETAKKKIGKPRNLTKKQRSRIRAGEDARSVDSQRDLRDFRKSVFGSIFARQHSNKKGQQPERPIIPPKQKIPKAWVIRSRGAFNSALRIILRRLN